ncbi:MAG TPA: hypothetical protein VGS19_15555 [Streptosporangiaceae bacterium]|nr:hypothetical protein [Streptosporangiaceae bacterium]
MTRVEDWYLLLAGRPTAVDIVAGSMHPDGRVRQTAVAALAATDGPLATAALAVRAADWVPQVAGAAVAALAARSAVAEVVAAVELANDQPGRPSL